MSTLTAVDDGALDALPPTSLPELDATAALQTRVDRKYALTAQEAACLLGALAPTARVLEIDGVRRFGYASTYFDTPDLLSFHLAARRRRRRFKVRTRTYVDTGACFLEVKSRAARGLTVKHRQPHDDAAHLGAGVGFVAERLVAARTGGDTPGARAASLAPVLATRFQRTTLLLPDARVTVDTGLVWTLLAHASGPHPRRAVLPLTVVETKSGGSPSSADRLLWRAGHRPDRISKYGAGLALLDPALPDHPWRRLLRQRLVTTEGTTP
ncbi:conserved hypothetical protein [Xylanimonas cellulosilytica DSM 15894]|uniref:VTC domain-containing protein n=1 Tax=Xylanimonas cellulosilytica (strain DSM 15894 / JCM 12276 / CECT 5975 / KCTC 9989 / LMG 20990 / NBRC 107835 / XIL07) TaxID=446471 RepID=D1C0K6_XYLCX|nr:polyphosphate polymerase domain-containing protein [Xylanimonas cellulosilytica]ACZ32209.1 conserved hypothetical protein [Xylanimonas cellulosilytica DSM 15894]